MNDILCTHTLCTPYLAKSKFCSQLNKNTLGVLYYFLVIFCVMNNRMNTLNTIDARVFFNVIFFRIHLVFLYSMHIMRNILFIYCRTILKCLILKFDTFINLFLYTQNVLMHLKYGCSINSIYLQYKYLNLIFGNKIKKIYI